MTLIIVSDQGTLQEKLERLEEELDKLTGETAAVFSRKQDLRKQIENIKEGQDLMKTLDSMKKTLPFNESDSESNLIEVGIKLELNGKFRNFEFLDGDVVLDMKGQDLDQWIDLA